MTITQIRALLTEITNEHAETKRPLDAIPALTDAILGLLEWAEGLREHSTQSGDHLGASVANELERRITKTLSRINT